MDTLYVLLKATIDPIVFLLILIAIGFIVSFKGRKKPFGKILLPSVFLVLYAASISPTANALCYILEKDYQLKKSDVEKLDVIVVLGGGISDNKYLEETMPSYQTASRLLYAVQMFRKSGAKYLVCSGKGSGRLSEAEVMKIAAERLGVSTANIKIDPESKDTWGHALNLSKMFHDNEIRIGLVTSAYHMRRSEREFIKYFSHVTPLPSDYLYSSPSLSLFTFLPGSKNLYKFSTALHEIVGISWYKIKG